MGVAVRVGVMVAMRVRVGVAVGVGVRVAMGVSATAASILTAASSVLYTTYALVHPPTPLSLHIQIQLPTLALAEIPFLDAISCPTAAMTVQLSILVTSEIRWARMASEKRALTHSTARSASAILTAKQIWGWVSGVRDGVNGWGRVGWYEWVSGVSEVG